ncbi:hypothetical protein DPMN_015017 [Dreissena polymorpha]|uniref:Uncharacterized protein n=1 Tax=Dreissena polymorpha TaxID=45954 RepID=A0A9D4N717_DREPO|nr:hypothetical protein DPMN_015017 [Dreissena polymorpha]
MPEKWLLVLLIVGGTALVFLVCFPIDFCLYRRRKRQVRRRKWDALKHSAAAKKVAIQHASFGANVTTNISCDDPNDFSSAPRESTKNRARWSFQRLITLIRRNQKDRMLDQEARLTKPKQTDDSSGNSASTPSPNSCELTVDDCGPTATQSDDKARLFENNTVNLTTSLRGGTDCKGVQLVNKLPHTTYTKLAKIPSAWGESDELLNYESKESVNETELACPDKSDHDKAHSKHCSTKPVSRQHTITVKEIDTMQSIVEDTSRTSSQTPHFCGKSKIDQPDISYHRCSIENLDDDYITSGSRYQRIVFQNPGLSNTEEPDIPDTVYELNLNDSVDKKEGVNKKSTPSPTISTGTGKESPQNCRVVSAISEDGLEMQKLNLHTVRLDVSKKRKASLTDDILSSSRSKSKPLIESELQSTYSLPVLNIRAEPN